MPLNIDWQQILLHLFNFLILATALTFLLFKPIRKFMREREEKYKKAAEEHAQKKAEIAQMEEDKKSRLAGLDAELEAHRQQVISGAESRGRELVAKAEDEARAIVEESRKRSEEERAAYMAGAGDEIAAMVVKSAEKLLVKGSSAENDSALYDSYLKTVNSEISISSASEEARAALAKKFEAEKQESKDGKSEVADAVCRAALEAIERDRTEESDGAVYDEFLRTVNGGSSDEK